MSPSIRLRLLYWVSPVLLLAGLAFAVPTYLNIQEEIEELFDKAMVETAYSLQSVASPGKLEPVGASLRPDAGEVDLITQVWDSEARLLSRSHALSPLPYAAAEGWASVEWQGESWRVFSVKTGERLIQVAQSTSERRQSIDEIALHLLTPLLILLPALALLVWFGIGRGLRPLQNIVDAVETRTPESLQPIADRGLPPEVGTLVTALNGLLQRLDDALARQRQFTADAAHELRSPLTALSLQAQVAERSTDPAKKAAALATLRQGIARASHLVQQLLTLARLDPEAARQPHFPLRLDELVRTVVADFIPLADSKGIDLGIVTAQSVTISGDAEALRILLGNLLDNALRYTPAGGRVDVSLLGEGQTVRLEVSDDGPGIEAAERSRVFDRFYRIAGHSEPGTGLGLAIVRRIADRHGASIDLENGAAKPGLKVVVRFPRQTP